MFSIPSLNLDAKAYHEAIEWPVWSSTGLDCEGGEYADPPLLKAVTDEEVNHLAENPLPAKYELPPVPCHSQAVERHVKLVSQASKKASSAEQVYGIVRATLLSRQKMPTFDSKREYKI